MITKVTKENSKLYRELFDKAEIYLNGKAAFESYDPENPGTYIAVHSLDEYFAMLEELTTGQSADGKSADEYHLFKILPLDEPTFDINADSRDILVPEVFRKNGVGVQGDQLAETLFFTIDRYFETVDLFRDDIQGIIQWESAAKGKQFETGWSPIAFKDVTIVKNKMVFGWFLNDVITSNPGTVKFSVRFFSTAKEYDASNNEVLKLSFSLSTKTQTITINPAISYDINEENGLPEVNAYNDLHLVVSRFKDSTYVGEADKAEDPVFTNTDGGIYYDAAQRVKYVETEDENGNEIRLHIVDLSADNGTLTLSTEATSTDAGKISYFWYEKDLAENSLVEKLTSGPVYIKTEDFAIDGTKTYYVKTEINGVIAFTEAKGLVDGELFDDAVDYYEAVNGVEVNSTGNYWVEAKNRHGVASAIITSETIVVPGPEALHVVVPTTEGNFLNSEGKITLKAVGTTEQKNDKIHYEWNNLTTQEHIDSVVMTNLGYKNGISENSGNSQEIGPVDVAEFPYFDQIIEVTAWAERNKDVTEEQKFEIRVTADPCAPSVTPVNQYPTAKLTDDVEIEVQVSLKKGSDERNIVSDEIKYQWFKYTSDETDNDFLIEGAT